MATLIGSDHAGLRHVAMYDQTFRGRSLHCSGITMNYGPDFCVSCGLTDWIFC